MLSKYKKMELRIQTYEQTHAQMEEYARYVLLLNMSADQCLTVGLCG